MSRTLIAMVTARSYPALSLRFGAACLAVAVAAASWSAPAQAQDGDPSTDSTSGGSASTESTSSGSASTESTSSGSASSGSAESSPSVTDIKQAAAEFDQGRKAFEAAEYKRAAQHFEAADALAPNPQPLLLAMQSREKAGDLPAAATLAALAMKRYPDNQKIAPVANKILEAAKDELHRLSVVCDEVCTLVVGMRIVPGTAARERVVYLEPGDQQVKASFQGYGERSETVSAVPGGGSRVEFARPAKPQASAPSDASGGDALGGGDVEVGVDERRSGGGISPAFFWVGLGLTAVAGGVTAWSGVDTLNNPGTDKVERECVGLGTNCPTYQEAKDKELRTNVLIGATAGLGALTVLFAILADWGGSSSSAASEQVYSAGVEIEPSFSAGPGGAFLGATGRF